MRPRLAADGALALQALFLLGPALGGEVFFRRDVHLMWFTQATVYERAWTEGSRLLWNPAMSFGQPLLADANNQIFYPATPLRLLLPPWTSYTVYVFLHLWLAGAGAVWLARRLGLGWLPAWASGALWMASGPLLSLVDTWNQLAGAAWMPWSIGAGLGIASPGGTRAVLAFSAVTALQLLAGAPETALLSLAGLVVLVAFQPRKPEIDMRGLLRTGRRFVAATLLAAALAACQWVPALQAARRSGRTELSREARTHWSIRPLHLAQMACPVPLHRLALSGPTRESLFGAPDPFLPSLYTGLVGAALAAAALARPSRVVYGLAGLAVLSTLIAMGRHAGLYDLLAAIAPPLRAFRYPAKALVLASLAFGVLCGFGLASLSQARSRRWLAVTSGLLTLGCAAVAWTMAFGATPFLERLVVASGVADARHLALRIAGAVLIAATAAVLAIARPTMHAGAFAALALTDLLLAHHDLNPTAPYALYVARPPALQTAFDPKLGRLYVWDYLEPGAGRKYLGRDVPYLLARAPAGWDLRAAYALGLRQALFPPSAWPWGSGRMEGMVAAVPSFEAAEGSYDRDVPGLEPSPLARLKDAFRIASPEQRLRLLRIGAVSRVAALHDASSDGLRPLGIYEGLFVDPVRVFEVPDPLPRTWVVGSARVVPDDGQAIATVLAPEFDPRREVVLASGAPRSAAAFEGRSRVRGRGLDRVSVAVELSAPGWVVMADAWDEGWHATVDGQPAPVERANVAFRAVTVPAGEHEVELVYRPAGVTAAIGASGAGLAVLAIAWWLTRRSSSQGAAMAPAEVA